MEEKVEDAGGEEVGRDGGMSVEEYSEITFDRMLTEVRHQHDNARSDLTMNAATSGVLFGFASVLIAECFEQEAGALCFVLNGLSMLMCVIIAGILRKTGIINIYQIVIQYNNSNYSGVNQDLFDLNVSSTRRTLIVRETVSRLLMLQGAFLFAGFLSVLITELT